MSALHVCHIAVAIWFAGLSGCLAFWSGRVVVILILSLLWQPKLQWTRTPR